MIQNYHALLPSQKIKTVGRKFPCGTPISLTGRKGPKSRAHGTRVAGNTVGGLLCTHYLRSVFALHFSFQYSFSFEG
jgi:hypothetical protein